MKTIFVLLLAFALISGCTTPPSTPALKTLGIDTGTKIYPLVTNEDIKLFVIFQNKRTYVFYDTKLYKKFLQNNEAIYRRTIIGGSPTGNTIVYVLTKENKEQRANPAQELIMGKVKILGNFYGEIFKEKENKYYIFTDWNNFNNYLHTEKINEQMATPITNSRGKNVTYILSNKNQKPTRAIAIFNSIHK